MEPLADGADSHQCVDTAADQRSALDRARYFSIFNQAALRDVENELPRRRVDFAAAHAADEEPAGNALDHLALLAGPFGHKGVAHPRHRQAGVGRAPTVAGQRQVIQARTTFVRQVIFQNSPFDEDCPPRRRPFVVAGKRTVKSGKRRVVNDRHVLRRDLTADFPRKGGLFLENQIGFHPMSAGLMDDGAAGFVG